ncbi:MAG: hypothetical protein HC866_19045 [Leptolyngbyaceae cyanobacterium RU_5_1]|nr:hypothetical protein [Leptolyngbyaceae cyanobacterium RU_5_1]
MGTGDALCPSYGFQLRDLQENKMPVNRVSTALNSQRLRVERSRSPAIWEHD